MYYDHGVKFRCLIEYGMNYFCARDLLLLDTANDAQMAIIHRTLVVHDFFRTKPLAF